MKSFLEIVIVAVAYILSGKLGLLLAIPPGYATAIWPPSGIAMAAVILRPRTAGYGVFLGSLILNLWVSVDRGASAASWTTILVALGIALGSTLQAVVGSLLVRKLLIHERIMDHAKEFVKFMLLCGPLSCLLSASVGVSVLMVSGLISPGQFPYSWWTWWVGDSIGVLIFAPVIIILASDAARVSIRRKIAVSIPLCLAFCLSVMLFLYVGHLEDKRLHDEMLRTEGELRAAVDIRVQRYVSVLESIRGFFLASEEVSEEEFDIFAHSALVDNPGVRALSWNSIVPLAERADFEERLRLSNPNSLGIVEFGSDNKLQQVDRRDEYAAVTLVSPAYLRRNALGFDVYSEDTRRQAFERAAASGKPTACGTIQLVQDSTAEPAFLLIVPVYHENETTRLRGYAVGLFHVQEMITTCLGPATGGRVTLEIYAGLGSLDTRPIATVPPPHHDASGSSVTSLANEAPHGILHDFDVNIAGWMWHVDLRPTSSFLSAIPSWQSWAILTGSLAMTAFLGALLVVLTGYSATVEREVGERTTELSTSNSNLQREIAQRHAAEGVLRQRSEEIKRFYQGLSHELKTPLSSSREFVSIVKDGIAGPVTESQIRFLSMAIEGCDEINRHIEDLLDVTRIETGKLTLRLTRSKYDRVVERAVTCLASFAESRRVSLNLSIQRPFPDVLIDTERMHQVCSNIIHNAIKFSPAGGLVEISLATTGLNSGETVLSVKDYGQGIDAEDQPKIFARLFQVQAAPDSREKGLGLGLHICQDIVRRHGGRIELESELHRGSTFTVRLPVRLDSAHMREYEGVLS